MHDGQLDLFDALETEVIVGARPTCNQASTLSRRADASNSELIGITTSVEDRPNFQPVMVLPFPLVARVGKIRDVATKMVATKSPRHAESYRAQVTEALRVNLTSKRVPTELQASELRQFWRAVDLEVARLLNPSRRPGGGKA